jgi:hypothetical protein
MYWKLALIALGLSCSLYLSYDYGYKKADTAFSAYKVELLKQTNAENDRLTQLAAKNKKDKEIEIASINRKHNAIVSSLQQRTSRVQETTTTPIVCTGAGSSGDRLYREDAEFLIGEATRAETLKQALLECRANNN